MKRCTKNILLCLLALNNFFMFFLANSEKGVARNICSIAPLPFIYFIDLYFLIKIIKIDRNLENFPSIIQCKDLISSSSFKFGSISSISLILCKFKGLTFLPNLALLNNFSLHNIIIYVKTVLW